MQKIWFKIFDIFLICIFAASCCCAVANPVSKAIDNTGLGGDSVISISVLNAKTKDCTYSRRPNIYLNPASALKIFTLAAALNELGDNYYFETIAYIDEDKNLYLKLGADPLLTSNDLNTLAKNIKTAYGGHIRNFYIDDTIIDKKPYPDGWTVDDLWPNSPKISPYIVDKNSVKVNFYVSSDKNSVKITQTNNYKLSFVNELKVGSKTDFKPVLNYGEKTGIITLQGQISSDTVKNYPILDPAQFFVFKLRMALDKNGISYSKPFYTKKVPQNAKRIASYRRPITEAVRFALKTSDNFTTETIFKLAGASWARNNTANNIEKAGSFEDAKAMFFDYYGNPNKGAGLNMDRVNLVDASGVSRYNAFSTFWMSSALVYLDEFSKIKEYMITADEGTLARRMRDLSGNLRAKTGTIFGVSSLAGYVTSVSNKDYVFSIIIQNYGVRPSLVKGLEDDIVYGIYSLE